MDLVEMGVLRTIAQALVDMQKDFVRCFGPDGSITKQLKSIEEQLQAINANVKNRDS